MILRWVGSALLDAEQQFRRVRGYREMPVLIEALRQRVTTSDRKEGRQVRLILLVFEGAVSSRRDQQRAGHPPCSIRSEQSHCTGRRLLARSWSSQYRASRLVLKLEMTEGGYGTDVMFPSAQLRENDGRLQIFVDGEPVTTKDAAERLLRPSFEWVAKT